MKHLNVLAALLLATFTFSFSQAQLSLEFVGLETEVEKDGVWGALDEKALIINTGNTTLSLIAERTVNDILAEHDSYFCWNLECYDPSRSVGDPVTVAPGDTITDYVLSVNPKGTPGVSTVTMAFYDENTPGDQASHTIRFTINETTGRVDAESFVSLSQPFPNPAFESARFDLQAGAFEHLEVRALDGRLVHTQQIDVNTSVVEINTSNFATGQYIAVFRGDAGVQSRRLAVQ